MSDSDDDILIEVVPVDIKAWVESAASDSVLYRMRQVTEVILTAIGLAPTLKESLVLKGGTLMALAFESPRLTTDVDFTAMAEPDGFDAALTAELNALMPRTAIQLGYLDLVCRVQSIEKKPRPQNFAELNFPALAVRIGSAIRGTGEERRLEQGQATSVVDVEVSFRDQVYHDQALRLSDAGVSVRAFTIHELVAEKMRALLQQPIRKRSRRQDVYDIALLVENHDFDEHDYALIFATLLEKCATRGITPNAGSMDDPEVVDRARREWRTLSLELAELPPFDERFRIVSTVYRALPWSKVVE